MLYLQEPFMEKTDLFQSRVVHAGAVMLVAAAGAKLAQKIIGNSDLAGVLANIGGGLIGAALGHAIIVETQNVEVEN
jgi:uncharacterized membrane protein YeaQ/YmgE (transglycosylase-associated protein family)